MLDLLHERVQVREEPAGAEVGTRQRPRGAAELAHRGGGVDPTPDDVAAANDLCDFDFVQLSGNEPADVIGAMPRPTIKALHVRAGQEATTARMVAENALRADRYLLDTHAEGLPGGTGRPFDWAALRAIGPSCLVAGGLKPDNVTAALASLAPFGVDVSSGVEFPTGGKDPRLIRAFLEAVRSYDHRPN
jgi:phosphoribosylanthranilate isomerase